MTKTPLRSRALWAAAIPLVVAGASLTDMDTENLAEDLEKLGAAVVLLVGALLGLWSRFRPDGAKLTGKSGALVLLLALPFALGCATRVSTDNPFLTVVWGDAYTLDCEAGQAVVAEGQAVCPEGDSVEVRGGHIGETMASIFRAALELVAGLLPRGPAGP